MLDIYSKIRADISKGNVAVAKFLCYRLINIDQDRFMIWNQQERIAALKNTAKVDRTELRT